MCKNLLRFGIVSLCLLFFSSAFAQNRMKIAFVNMNEAINQSESGRESRKLLENKFNEFEKSLRELESQILKLRGELENSILLKAEAKQKKEAELRELETLFQRRRGELTSNLREDEARHTETLYQKIKRVVGVIAKEEKYDLVIESAMLRMLLFTGSEVEDITNQVILEFNKSERES